MPNQPSPPSDEMTGSDSTPRPNPRFLELDCSPISNVDSRLPSPETPSPKPIKLHSVQERKLIYLPLIALIGLISFAVIASHSGSVGTKLQQPDATIKHDPISLPNGTILKSSDGWGANELTIENGIDSDAVVKLVPSMNPSQASMIVYVRANNTAFLKGISPGSYSLWYMLGSDWSEGTKKFLSISACSKLAKELVFTQTDVTTSQWTITLHPVVNGNASSVRLEQTLFDSTN